MKCANCGAKNSRNSIACANCGASFAWRQVEDQLKGDKGPTLEDKPLVTSVEEGEPVPMNKVPEILESLAWAPWPD